MRLKGKERTAVSLVTVRVNTPPKKQSDQLGLTFHGSQMCPCTRQDNFKLIKLELLGSNVTQNLQFSKVLIYQCHFFQYCTCNELWYKDPDLWHEAWTLWPMSIFTNSNLWPFCPLITVVQATLRLHLEHVYWMICEQNFYGSLTSGIVSQ